MAGNMACLLIQRTQFLLGLLEDNVLEDVESHTCRDEKLATLLKMLKITYIDL